LDLYAFLRIDKSFKLDMEREYNVFSMPKNGLIHKLYALDLIRNHVSALISDILKEKIKNLFFETNQQPELEQETKEYLQDLYSDNIRELERSTGRDLTGWYKEDNN